MTVSDQTGGDAVREQCLAASQIAEGEPLHLCGLHRVEDRPLVRTGLLEAGLPAGLHRVPGALGRRGGVVPGGGVEGGKLPGQRPKRVSNVSAGPDQG